MVIGSTTTIDVGNSIQPVSTLVGTKLVRTTDDNIPVEAHIQDAGLCDMFKLRLKNGYYIFISKDQQILTYGGWSVLEDIADLKFAKDNGIISKARTIRVAILRGNEIAWSLIASITYEGKMHAYEVECEKHFIADKFILG